MPDTTKVNAEHDQCTMAATTSKLREVQSPAQAGAFGDAGFADSGIMDMTTPTLSPQSKPQFETDRSELKGDGAYDYLVDCLAEPIGHQLELAISSSRNKHPDQAIKNTNGASDRDECRSYLSSKTSPEDALSDSEPTTESECEPDPELISHLTTTVSSLRLRGQEQLHLHALFTSKLEALAQRSLQQESTIRDVTSQLQSLRELNTTLGRENATLTHENNDLRVTMQDLKGDILERELAMEAMTGAVRGLEGWIESANNSPRSHSQIPVHHDRAGHRIARRDVVRGKGRFRGRYPLEGKDGTGNREGHGIQDSTDVEPIEIQEGVMAWVRGFKDVEEGLKARHEMDGRDRDSSHVNGRHAGNNHGHDDHNDHNDHNDDDDDTIDTFDEDFGEYETG